MVFPSCIQDIWINPNKKENVENTKNPHEKNEKPRILKKEDLKCLNPFFSGNRSLIK